MSSNSSSSSSSSQFSTTRLRLQQELDVGGTDFEFAVMHAVMHAEMAMQVRVKGQVKEQEREFERKMELELEERAGTSSAGGKGTGHREGHRELPSIRVGNADEADEAWSDGRGGNLHPQGPATGQAGGCWLGGRRCGWEPPWADTDGNPQAEEGWTGTRAPCTPAQLNLGAGVIRARDVS